MRTIDPELRHDVVVGVINNQCDQFLVQQRQAGKVCAGKWEFPGGKVEQGETPYQALIRELHEELGIRATELLPLAQISHDYPHLKVLLWVFRVTRFELTPTNNEGQRMSWQSIQEIRKMDLLEAVHPILAAMEESFAPEPTHFDFTLRNGYDSSPST